MKKYILLVALMLSTLGLFAQSEKIADVKVGDVFEIGKLQTNTYKNIQLPKLNIIKKRGGITLDLNLEGSIVVVTGIKSKKDGTTIVKLKRQDGTRFFRTHKIITANINGALQSGELQAK
ncbi:hypothetical protein ACFO3O_06035 [Dokdonia ponticola]|uniref:Dihydroorotase n=1 Tax=Dokdonia ponticola TaxID=2041041 RepID=A0ABV9HVC3_9FLAO